MKIGLYFGSFNPIHHAHLIIANSILNDGLVKKVWFVVSPHNPLKETKALLGESQRLHLVNTAIEDDARMKATNIEFALPRPSYTSITLAHLSEKYPQHEFFLIMGGDSIQNIKRWKNYQFIISTYKILIYNRPGFEIPMLPEALSITILKAPLLELSATEIRKLLKEKKSVKYLLPDNVISEIEKSGYYRK